MAADVFDHVKDADSLHLPYDVHLHLPEIFGFQITRFMVMQVVAGLLTFVIFKGLASRVAGGQAVRGRFWNFWEAIAIYIRDEVVRPTIGEGHHHDDEHGHPAEHDCQYAHRADKYLPFVWSCFFYVLFCNLLGAFPSFGSATGEINVTAALAATVFVMVVYYGSQVSGVAGFWLALSPSLPGPLKVVHIILWPIELAGLFIKHTVLAIRLFANIMAGHIVLAIILGFIAVGAKEDLQWVITPASVAGQLGVSVLELGVAFLQAYVFSFMTTLFISTAVNPH